MLFFDDPCWLLACVAFAAGLVAGIAGTRRWG